MMHELSDSHIESSIDILYGDQIRKVTDEHWESIRKSLKLPNNTQITLANIKDAVEPALWEMKRHPSPSDIVKQLDGLRKTARSFVSELNSLQSRARNQERIANQALIALCDAIPNVGAPDICIYDMRVKINVFIKHVNTAITEQSKRLGKDRGRKKNDSRDEAVIDMLAKAFKKLTGKEPDASYSGSENRVMGDFDGFVQAVLKPFGISRSGRTIAEDLKKRKSSAGLSNNNFS